MMSRVCAPGSPVAALPSASSPETNRRLPARIAGAEVRALLRVGVDRLARRGRRHERHLDLVGRARQRGADRRPRRRRIGTDDLAVDAVELARSPSRSGRKTRALTRCGKLRPAASSSSLALSSTARVCVADVAGHDGVVLAVARRSARRETASRPRGCRTNTDWATTSTTPDGPARRSAPAGTATADISTSAPGVMEIGDDGRAGRRRGLQRLLVGLVHRRKVRGAAEVDGDDDGVGERRALGAQALVEARQRQRGLLADVVAGVRRGRWRGRRSGATCLIGEYPAFCRTRRRAP